MNVAQLPCYTWIWHTNSCTPFHQRKSYLPFPTTIPLVAPIFGLHYTCGQHTCTVWLTHNISPSAHICHITSTPSLFLPTIWLPNSHIRSPYRLFYIECCWINYNFIYIYIYIYIYTFVYIRTLISQFQCTKQWVNQFSNDQQSITAVCYDELRWSSLSHKLSPISILQKSDFLSEAKCSLCLVTEFCVHSVESIEGVWGRE